MVRVHCVTLATKPHPNLDVLLRLAKNLGLRPQVLGMGDQRMQSWGEAFGIKMEYLMNACKDFEDHDILVQIDAFDIIPLARESEIVEGFSKMDADLVFGAETACAPRPELAGAFDAAQPDSGATHRYLNSGFSVGYVGAYKRMVTGRPFKSKDDDQVYWSEVFLTQRGVRGQIKRYSMRLDYNSTIVMNLYNARGDLHYDGSGRYHRISTGARPCFLHLNGGANDYMDLAGPLLRRIDDKNTLGKQLQRLMYGGRFSIRHSVPPSLVFAVGVLILVLVVLALQ